MYEKELQTAIEAVTKAGNIIKKFYGKPIAEEQKENWQEIVTEADRTADEILCNVLRRDFPKYTILSEESKRIVPKSEFTWFVDPLDGTTNFVTQIPFFCSAVGLLHNNEPIVSAVFNPISNELFIARKGGGTYLNGKKIHVSPNNDIKKTLINFCHKNKTTDVERIGKVWPKLKMMGRDLRRLGSGNLDIAYVACGRNDAYFSNSKLVDIAPSLTIAIEAGCKITDWKNWAWTKDSNDIIITNGTKIHDDIVAVLKKI